MVTLNLYLIFNEKSTNRHDNINNCLNLIKNICNKNNINIEIKIINEPSKFYIDENIEKYNKRVDYSHYTDNTEYNDSIINLNSHQISNYEKHRIVFKFIADNVKYDDETFHMIIEDDIFICNSCIENIEELIKNLNNPENNVWDILFTSLNTINADNKLINYNDVYKRLISKSCYFIKPQICLDLYDSMETFKINFKLFLSKFIKDKNIKAFFYNKNTFSEGSKIGIYPSTTNPNNHLYFNNHYIELVTISNKEIIEDTDIQNAESIYTSSLNIESADILNIMGIIYYKYCDYNNAKKYTTDALYNLKKNKGYIQKNSNILNNCINMYQFDQEYLKECLKTEPKY